ncbi:MAG: DUF433 domain-containing protein [Propionibacteriales bacterium]|nr:DUF433 domain-containing protein [Propionibacteriales bacterium]
MQTRALKGPVAVGCGRPGFHSGAGLSRLRHTYYGILSSMEAPLSVAAADGCYEAARAAALSGVPKSTMYWWARQGIVVPSVSPVQEKLWSYSDLMCLRIVSWLRHPKAAPHGAELPANPMSQVRRALVLLERRGLDLWAPDSPGHSPILVDAAGAIFVRSDGEILDLHEQPALLPEGRLELTMPFRQDGVEGPNLLRPRPHLRIVPAKVAGEPHIADTRLTTQSVAALAARGFSSERIADMYASPVESINEAIDLERQLMAVPAIA